MSKPIEEHIIGFGVTAVAIIAIVTVGFLGLGIYHERSISFILFDDGVISLIFACLGDFQFWGFVFVIYIIYFAITKQKS